MTTIAVEAKASLMDVFLAMAITAHLRETSLLGAMTSLAGHALMRSGQRERCLRGMVE
jgi:hypothetical protein